MSTVFTSTVSRRFVPGDRYASIVTLVGPTSYTTGGIPVTPATFGFSQILDYVDIGNSSAAHPAFYDAVNQKIKLYTAQGTEVANAVNVSAVTLNCLAFGV